MNFAETRGQILYNAILISILILYGLFGAYVFRTLETQNVASLENSQPEISREELLKELWNQNNLVFDDWSAKVTGKLDSYEKRLSLDTSSPAEWSLADSWLFACTVFTTIGYGNIVPVSKFGRIFCILYGLVGIPLFSVVASNLASFIRDVLQLLHRANQRRKRRLDVAKQKKDEGYRDKRTETEAFHLTLPQILALNAAYLAIGAVLFSSWEEWSLFESFYYCFVTLTTTGLGDYVPQKMHHTVAFGGYILVGLVLVTMLFTTMEEKIAQWFNNIKQMVGLVEHHNDPKKEL
ncbi:putative stabilization of membrane [Porites harrisoni]